MPTNEQRHESRSDPHRNNPRSQRSGGSERARKPLMLTTVIDGHAHTWRQGAARTSVDDGHSHRVVLGRVQRSVEDGHRHEVDREMPETELEERREFERELKALGVTPSTRRG